MNGGVTYRDMEERKTAVDTLRKIRAELSEAVAALALADGPVQLAEHISAFRVAGPLRLSDHFMRFWCGQHDPTEELRGWLADRGLEIVPGGDQFGGWDVRMVEQAGERRLF